ncbi:MAG: hypothetical protein ACLP8A_09820 [Methylovirgula sp.]
MSHKSYFMAALVILAVASMAYLFRFEVVTMQGLVVIQDRWRGTVEVCTISGSGCSRTFPPRQNSN